MKYEGESDKYLPFTSFFVAYKYLYKTCCIFKNSRNFTRSVRK